MRAKWLLTATALAALTTGVAACGSGSGSSSGGGGGGASGGAISGSTLTIYSSLPLQGGSRDNALAVNRGADIALQEKGAKVGNYTIKFQKLDDSTASAGKWEPNQTQQNARKAVADTSTIAYLGEFNSGASALSIPTNNRAGILQVSPANTAVGLTSTDPGASAGEPDKYYPTKKRNYARVVPRDTVQAAAQVTLWKENGCKKVYIVNDKEVYGEGLSKSAEQAVKQQGGVAIVANEGYDPKAGNYKALAGKIASSGADCFFGSIIVDNNGVKLFTDIANGAKNIKLFGPDGVAEEAFTGKDGVSADVGKRTLITVATLDPADYPPAGKAFFAKYTKETGDKTPAPYAIYGYESMSLILDSIKKDADAHGGKVSRQGTIDALFSTKGRQSVLGTYDIDKNGDTTLTDYGLYKVAGGQLVFNKVIKAGGGG